MTDRILRLHCRPKCEECEYGTILTERASEIERDMCPICSGRGYTDSVMEFEEVTDDEDLYWFQSKEGYKIPHGLPVRVTSPYKAQKLNPTHLEVIEVKECSECGGSGDIITSIAGEIHSEVYNDCTKCNDKGKISVVTQFTVFGMGKKEYEREFWRRNIKMYEEAVKEKSD